MWNRVKVGGMNATAQQIPAATPKGNQFEALSTTTKRSERMHINVEQQQCASRETSSSMQRVKKKVIVTRSMGPPSVAKQKAQLRIDAAKRAAKQKYEREEAKKTIQDRKEQEGANY